MICSILPASIWSKFLTFTFSVSCDKVFIDYLKGVFYMNISGSTRLVCLLGSPVAHSISPAMHNASFQYHDLDYAYLAFDVGEEKLASVVEALKEMNVRGFNLTMPDKNKMCTLCDRLSPAAEISESVNTVLNENGVLTGYTTDGIGYMKACEDAGFHIIGKKMTLFGAGGAATAILVRRLWMASVRFLFSPEIQKENIHLRSFLPCANGQTVRFGFSPMKMKRFYAGNWQTAKFLPTEPILEWHLMKKAVFYRMPLFFIKISLFLTLSTIPEKLDCSKWLKRLVVRISMVFICSSIREQRPLKSGPEKKCL